MCGIIGLITDNNAKQKILNELYKLEYRGYDSAGICVIDKEGFETTKSVGSIKNLQQIINFDNDNFTTGIAHTRWATHGKANITNCHPHISYDGVWAVVHNGIVENYAQLKDFLKKHNIRLKSQTDSEVIPNLLSISSSESNIKKLIQVCSNIKGSYALVCINKYNPKTLYIARKDSPIYVANTKEGVIVSSDTISFINKTDTYYALDNFEFAQVDNEKILFFDKNGNQIHKNHTKLSCITKDTTLESYNHFMIKEIFEVPSLISNVYKFYVNNKELIFDFKNLLNKSNKIMFVGCGTAYHSALMGEKFFNKYLNIPVSCHIASEFVYDNLKIDEKTICIFISQSGETADTISALKYALKHNAKCIALTNNINSQIAFIADYTWPILAGVEIAVASTKAYNCQCLCLYLVAKLCSEFEEDIKAKFLLLSNNLQNIDVSKILMLAQKVKRYKSVFFIGRNIDYVTALESSLKLKEITYINSVACQSGELKHGTLALIDKNSLVITSITQPSLKEKCINAIYEIKARGAKVVVLSPFEEIQNILSKKDTFIKIEQQEPEFSYQECICNMQLLSYYVSVQKNINPDKPRNLAKSVTVE